MRISDWSSDVCSSDLKEAGKFTEGVILSKSMEVLFRAVPPSLYLALAQTEPEEKAERYQLMQQYGCTELEAAFKVAEKIDQARGIASPALELSTAGERHGPETSFLSETVAGVSSCRSEGLGVGTEGV